MSVTAFLWVLLAIVAGGSLLGLRALKRWYWRRLWQRNSK